MENKLKTRAKDMANQTPMDFKPLRSTMTGQVYSVSYSIRVLVKHAGMTTRGEGSPVTIPITITGPPNANGMDRKKLAEEMLTAPPNWQPQV